MVADADAVAGVGPRLDIGAIAVVPRVDWIDGKKLAVVGDDVNTETPCCC